MTQFQIKQRPLLTHPEQFQGVPTLLLKFWHVVGSIQMMSLI